MAGIGYTPRPTGRTSGGFQMTPVQRNIWAPPPQPKGGPRVPIPWPLPPDVPPSPPPVPPAPRIPDQRPGPLPPPDAPRDPRGGPRIPDQRPGPLPPVPVPPRERPAPPPPGSPEAEGQLFADAIAATGTPEQWAEKARRDAAAKAQVSFLDPGAGFTSNDVLESIFSRLGY